MSKEDYVKLLKDAAIALYDRAEDIVGEVDKVRRITISTELEPGAIADLKVNKKYIAVPSKRVPWKDEE